jgi:hypothetical protein
VGLLTNLSHFFGSAEVGLAPAPPRLVLLSRARRRSCSRRPTSPSDARSSIARVGRPGVRAARANSSSWTRESGRRR